NSLEVIETASAYLEENYGKKRPVFGGQKTESLPAAQRASQAALLAPVLRGLASSYKKMVGTFTDTDVVLQFINSNDLGKLAPMGTSCPDHFLRTKISPLVLDIPADIDLSDPTSLKADLEKEFQAYREMY
ncbi:bifunctional rhamnulose-1-phosphate aldolase/short-chain dehydrogenase, partial [Algoriphagus sp. YJ13C]|nr:bifunctional rhamnulose-1-phosphate aldolase/short-chain dehydrogenase [Algoriphagus pacificus]